jgi:hypothetical protein
MATHTTPAASTSRRRNEGAPEYSEDIPDTPAEQARALYSMLRETLHTNRRIEEFLFDLDQRVEALETKQKMSMDELWRSVPSKKTNNLGSGKYTKPYSRIIQTTREKPRLSLRLGLPPLPSQRRKSLAERLGVPPSFTPLDPTIPVGNHPPPDPVSASEHQLPLLKQLQPRPLVQRLMSPS